MTHAELVSLAARWLRSTRHAIVHTDPTVNTLEQPDAIGWARGGCSTLVECKTSRADFIADRAKSWRRHPSMGMGRLRYFLLDRAFITEEELPAGWGLLYPHGRSVRVVKKAVLLFEWSHLEETRLLVRIAAGPSKVWRKKPAGLTPPLVDQAGEGS